MHAVFWGGQREGNHVDMDDRLSGRCGDPSQRRAAQSVAVNVGIGVDGREGTW